MNSKKNILENSKNEDNLKNNSNNNNEADNSATFSVLSPYQIDHNYIKIKEEEPETLVTKKKSEKINIYR